MKDEEVVSYRSPRSSSILLFPQQQQPQQTSLIDSSPVFTQNLDSPAMGADLRRGVDTEARDKTRSRDMVAGGWMLLS